MLNPKLPADQGERRKKQIDQLYRQHKRALTARLRKVYGAGPPDPQDLVQIAFAKLAATDDIDAIRKPGAFLFRVAVNAGLDQVDRLASARRFEEEQLRAVTTVQTATPETVYLGQEALLRLGRMVDALPAQQREIVYRARFKGETLTEIAQDMQVNVSSVSRQLAKAMARLRTGLNEDDMNAMEQPRALNDEFGL